MGNISGLGNLTTAATSLSNLILVTPQKTIGYQPQNRPPVDGQPAQQPPALLFDYEGEQTINLQSDITDHYIEDNTALQDQIALRPEKITTHGFIGELNDIAPSFLAGIQAVANKLTNISAYTPELSATALNAYNQAFQLYQVTQNAIHSAVSAWATVTGLITGQGGESVIGSNGLVLQPNQSRQQKMLQQLYGYWRNRTLFTVQTPWAVFENMAIETLTSVQDDQTNVITEFTLTFKMIRIASTQISLFDPSVLQGRSAIMAGSANPTDLGTSTPPSSIGLDQGLSSYPSLPSSAVG